MNRPTVTEQQVPNRSARRLGLLVGAAGLAAEVGPRLAEPGAPPAP